jgi:ornithine cyclodeaminase
MKTFPTSASTLFLSASTVADILAREGVPSAVHGMTQYIREDFLNWNAFEKSARLASHSNDGVIELMPVSNDEHFSFKYVNGHPLNGLRGMPTVMAFGVLARVDTGAPEMLSEMTLTTAVRTAAVSALAAKALARPESRIMALIGNGAQSEFQALAFHHMLGIEEVRLFDIDLKATAKLMKNLAGSGLRVVCCASVMDAVRGADIVTTVTADKKNATILTAKMIAPGTHINAVGGDCPGKTELSPELLASANVFVEYEPQTRVEGDIQQMSADFPVTELWQVLAGQRPGRGDASEITIFDSVGFALEDFSALRYMRDRALALGLGEIIELIPNLPDPRDLFGAIRVAGRRDARVAVLAA